MSEGTHAYLLGGFLKLVMTALLCVIVRERGVLKYLPTLGTLDALRGYKISVRKETSNGHN